MFHVHGWGFTTHLCLRLHAFPFRVRVGTKRAREALTAAPLRRMPTMSRLALGLLLASSIATAFATGCASDPATADDRDSSEDALAAKADEHWIYAGPLPALSNAKITASLAGNTAHVTGYLPTGAAALPDLPHVKTRIENGTHARRHRLPDRDRRAAEDELEAGHVHASTRRSPIAPTATRGRRRWATTSSPGAASRSSPTTTASRFTARSPRRAARPRRT